MAFTGRTPEADIPRSDSRNPATTCKGITRSGRPCRRDIGAPKASRHNGVLAVVSVVSDSDEEETGAAAYFCWQHKDQAEQLAAANATAPNGQDTHLYPLQDRNSIDTLVARLGVLDVGEPAQATQRKKRRRSKPNDTHSGSRPPRPVNRPPTWDRVQGPLMSVPSNLMAEKQRLDQTPQARPPQRKKPGFWAMLCCGSADDDYAEVQPRRPLNKTTPRNSETTNLLSYIPPHLSPKLTSSLLAELGKPISPTDEEGYIYIFWLTPESLGPAPSSTASTLLVPPSRPEQGQRTTDVLRQYSVRKPQGPRPATARNESSTRDRGSEQEKNTILLKIGRANNVHRRMNEWARQCGYSLSLVRYYPYVSSTPQPSPQASPRSSRQQNQQNQDQASRRASAGVRKVPHAHRVERLIHLELGEQRVMKRCDACGKEHREWFEVEASKEGVKAVDEVVKRWVGWAERTVE
ncbi:meiotically up-regulated gene 113-domain-containing protein [Massariosphaeria phaeospora]|uniref:Meiotically up-regulated gene 113-domain-containing protein n=1 Tax=Massariosphaeria phaeospora TaxID=100035 RepID=A0A7C8HZP7_9PLEO|nr:meiotically up-regulated gene 113-domain-containing protein [Massariosphaeria phaeospora]